MKPTNRTELVKRLGQKPYLYCDHPHTGPKLIQYDYGIGGGLYFRNVENYGKLTFIPIGCKADRAIKVEYDDDGFTVKVTLWGIYTPIRYEYKEDLC